MRKRQEGSAMIVVMCVMVVAVALSLALLLSASVMGMNAQRANQKEQCRITAASVSDVLVKQIRGFKYEGMAEFPGLITDNRKNDLRAKLLSFGSSEWPSYDKNAGATEQILKGDKNRYSYLLQGENLPGVTTVVLYWEEEIKNSEKPSIDDPEKAQSLLQSRKLYVEVTSTAGEERSTVTSLFHPVANLSDEKDPNTGKKTWANWAWQYDGREWERRDS